MEKKLYKISQSINSGYDTYDSAVVCAESEQDARNIHPSSYVTHIANGKWMGTYSGGAAKGNEYENDTGDWVCYGDINCITVEYIGVSDESIQRGVIVASFNAG